MACRITRAQTQSMRMSIARASLVWSAAESGRFVLRMLEATTGIEPVYAVLQTAPWPLGHVAMLISRWLPREDSNLGSRIQSPLSYH